MGLRFLWATDGSPNSRAALPLLERLFLPAADVVYVLVVAPRTATEGERPDPIALLERLLPGYQERLTEETTRVATEATDLVPKGVAKIETLVRLGRPASVIVDVAEDVGADVILVGSRGYTGLKSLLMGSVSSSVLTDAHCSVLIARPDAAPLERILFATDGSDAARSAEAFLASLPRPEGVRVTVLSVAEPYVVPAAVPLPYAMDVQRITDEILRYRQEHAERAASEAARRLTEAGWPAEPRTAFGPAAATIVAEADALGAGLIVVGAAGMNPIERFVVGSVAARVARVARRSVLVVRRPE
ncbi:MAG TPA: universal stress protein [Dehalococcoidia bacterium]|nr:universal stress protein [Dehalococcoidia bacterium]